MSLEQQENTIKKKKNMKNVRTRSHLLKRTPFSMLPLILCQSNEDGTKVRFENTVSTCTRRCS